MSYYKVPQDVEAEDKLIGPFSFRQFVYLMIVAALIAVAWGLSRIFIGLALIPAPVIIFFGALALPLRKDQPTETYLAAIVTFLLKPRVRLWDPEGIENNIEILAPKIISEQLIKEISGEEAAQKLGYLAQVVDSGGWSTVNPAALNSPNPSTISGDILAEANSTPDILDTYAQGSQNINKMIGVQTNMRKDQLIDEFKKEAATHTGDLQAVLPQVNQAYTSSVAQQFAQTVANTTPQTTSAQPINPAIMNLANDDALSVETIAKQANRIVKQSDDEVIISLR
jgi:hypothetical protein